MSSRIIDDVKTGVQGIRGAGDALRGNLLQATDQAFDGSKQGHGHGNPTTQASELKNQAIAEKGKADIDAADEMLARRERESEARKLEREARAGAAAGAGAGTATGLAGNGAGARKGTGHHPLPLQ
ncbi:hypothetical protein F5Y14DRAFT_192174 [Nemania sp. NC0429]|nr:hypothetical protein F5Y14DRAFT_192174 [Nemania sp. NC0429]